MQNTFNEINLYHAGFDGLSNRVAFPISPPARHPKSACFTRLKRKTFESVAPSWFAGNNYPFLTQALPEIMPNFNDVASDDDIFRDLEEFIAELDDDLTGHPLAGQSPPVSKNMAQMPDIVKTLTESYPLIPLSPTVNMEMIRIPSGTFLMGSDNGERDEKPQHEVRLDQYWIGRYPVTNRQWQVYVNQGSGTPPSHWEDNAPPAGFEDHPVVFINWQDAADFCAWLAKISAVPLRLPTEAEWEKAARGTDGRIYPWGNAEPDRQRCNYNAFTGTTTPVGAFSPQGDSPYGCADMAGNVWEWVNDWYQAKYLNPAQASTKLQGAASGVFRCLRGGSFIHDAYFIRTANRNSSAPQHTNAFFGFRCAI